MYDLLAGLAARGHTVSLVCESFPSALGTRSVSFPVATWNSLGRSWFGFIGRRAFCEFESRQGAQVIHVHGTDLCAAGHGFLKAASAPVVFTPFSSVVDAREVRRVQRRAQRVIALSEYMREGLVNRCRVPREKLRVVPPGIEMASYELLPPRMGERTPVIGTVAPLDAGRGQSTFLRAARLLLDSSREAEFVVAGDGPQERALREEAAALGVETRVAFVTRLAGYRSVISALDVFVRPALSGGLGYTVLEAMAMGKAVIATATGDVPELLEEGKTGFMIPKADESALAKAVADMLDHPDKARALGLAARAEVAERFNMDRRVENALRVYAEAVETGGKNEA
jgi:glycosyltransferase involved in cell wall biosynthesis